MRSTVAWDQDLRDEVGRHHINEPGLTGGEIRQRLVDAHPELDPWAKPPEIPPVRTINAWLQALGRRDKLAWSLATAEDPADARVVLSTLREVIKQSRGGIRAITTSEARWLVRIIAARPDFEGDLWTAYVLARLYVGQEQRKAPYTSLDLQLATEGDDEAQRMALGRSRPLASLASGVSRATGRLTVKETDSGEA